jgi:hippurate hydrolase
MTPSIISAYKRDQLDAIEQRMIKLRRHFHQQAELAYHERETAHIIIRELDRLNIPYEYAGVGHGIVANIEQGKNLPRIAFRAEMDALPGHENTDLSFASKNDNTMHACGHDAHMAIVLGTAALLKIQAVDINVTLIFQPAEESGAGALVMIKDDALRDISAIFGGHVTHHYGVGEIMVNEGVITAQSDRFKIEIKGKGGHGARPHEAIDAVVIASGLVNAVQTVVSREINPLHPSVITIGTVHAGTAANVIAENAILEGSIRSTREATRQAINKGLERMTRAFASLHDAEIKLTLTAGYPPVINTQTETQLARQAAINCVGDMGVTVSEYPSMGSEDFAYYLHHVPGCYVRFGARPPKQEYIPLHSPAFDIDESVLLVGALYFKEIANLSATHYQHKAE